MVVIKFADTDTQDEAIGFLAGHFSVYLQRSGEVIVPESALGSLANENFSFTVMGRATHAQQESALRGDVADGVQRRQARPKKLVRKSASRGR